MTGDIDPERFQEIIRHEFKRFDRELKKLSILMGNSFKAYARVQFDTLQSTDFLSLSEKREWGRRVIDYLDMRLSQAEKIDTTHVSIINRNAYNNVLHYHR